MKGVAWAVVLVVLGAGALVPGHWRPTLPDPYRLLAQSAGRSATERAATIVVETSKGSFTFETFPAEAPLTVKHITALVRAGFFDGQRVHRALPGFLVQFGDPQSRDEDKQALWGRGTGAASGSVVGAAEFSKSRVHRKGAVGIAHMGDPSKADSQIYVTLANRPDLDGRYVVFGQVSAGDDVPARLEAGDTIRRLYVKE